MLSKHEKIDRIYYRRASGSYCYYRYISDDLYCCVQQCSGRAHNAASVTGVRQAVVAIEAYRAKRGHYPTPTSGNDIQGICLGAVPPDYSCGSTEISPGCGLSLGDPASPEYFNQQIEASLSGALPKLDFPPVVNTFDLVGCTFSVVRTGPTYTAVCKVIISQDSAGDYAVGNQDSGNCARNQAYMIEYMLKGGNANCGLSQAVDNSSRYLITYHGSDWTRCTAYGGAVEFREG